jgi:mono/diheme cytochrome c family protein
MRKTASCICGIVLMAGLAAAADETTGDVAKGKEVFEQCGACHNTDTDEKKMGPSLKGLYKKAKLSNGKPVNDANVKAVINAGGNGMPAYADLLTDEERTNLLAYLKTL